MTTNTAPAAPAAGGTPAAGGAPGAPAAGTPAPAAGAAPVAGTPAPVASDFKLPEGLKVEPKLIESFKATATELKLEGPAAQKVLDVFLSQQKAAIEADEARYTQQESKWVEEITKDPELGGANLAASRTNATKAVMKYGGEPLAQLLKATGLDNNPVFFRTFAKLGKAMGEDTLGGSGSTPPPGKSRDLQAALYPPKA